MNTLLSGRLSVPYFRLLLLCLTIAALATSGCGGDDAPPPDVNGPPIEAASDEHSDEHGDDHSEGEPGTIHLEEDQLRLAGIKTAEVELSTLRGAFDAPGRVVPGLTGSAHVGTLVSGRIVRLYANEGTAVRRGTPLAEVESFEVAELKGAYLQADAQAEQAQAALTRQEQLAAENLTAERELEQARAAYRSAEAAVTAAATKLAALGISPDEIEAGSGPQSARFIVRAPIGGTITKRDVQLGEYVEPSRDLFEVASSGSDLVEAQVPVGRAASLEAGSTATILLDGNSLGAGRVVAIAPIVASDSRTVPVRIKLSEGTLRPGTFVTVRLDTDAGRDAVVVPLSAIERAGGETFVYVTEQDEAGTFRRVPVQLGAETAEGVEVLAGLESGQQIAVEGVFYLRSARQKGELAEHDH